MTSKTSPIKLADHSKVPKLPTLEPAAPKSTPKKVLKTLPASAKLIPVTKKTGLPNKDFGGKLKQVSPPPWTRAGTRFNTPSADVDDETASTSTDDQQDIGKIIKSIQAEIDPRVKSGGQFPVDGIVEDGMFTYLSRILYTRHHT